MKYLFVIFSAFFVASAFAGNTAKVTSKPERSPASSRPWYYQCQFAPDFKEDLGRFQWVWIPTRNGIARDKWAEVSLVEKVVGGCERTGGQNDKLCVTATIDGRMAECNSENIGKFVATKQ